jgi:hypothetical protein
MIVRKGSLLYFALCRLPGWLIFMSAARVQQDTTSFVRVQFTWTV